MPQQPSPASPPVTPDPRPLGERIVFLARTLNHLGEFHAAPDAGEIVAFCCDLNGSGMEMLRTLRTAAALNSMAPKGGA